MLNSEFVHEQAALFADRLAREASTDVDGVALAYRLAVGRSPAADELQEAEDFLQQVSQRFGELSIPEVQRTSAAWASYLRVLLSGNTFLFVD
jgi:hypothetical protein